MKLTTKIYKGELPSELTKGEVIALHMYMYNCIEKDILYTNLTAVLDRFRAKHNLAFYEMYDLVFSFKTRYTAHLKFINVELTTVLRRLNYEKT